jgi:hypothetical protein
MKTPPQPSATLRKMGRDSPEAFRKEALGRIYGFSNEGFWVYALVAADRPIYVGQTSKPEKRFHNHLKVAYGGRDERGPKRKAAIRSGHSLSMVALARVGSRIEALAYEAAWARHLRALGYSLENSWSEHDPGNPVDRVPLIRIPDLSIREAMGQGLKLQLECSPCNIDTTFDSSDVAKRVDGNPTIRTMQAKFRCPGCGSAGVLGFKLSDDAQAARVFPNLSGATWPPDHFPMPQP